MSLCDPVDSSLPGSSVHGICQARILEWVAIPFCRESSRTRTEPVSPTLQVGSLPSEPPGKPLYFLVKFYLNKRWEAWVWGRGRGSVNEPWFNKHWDFQVTGVGSEKAMAPYSSTLAWKIPWMEEPARLQSMGLRRVGHDWATSLSLFTFMYWRRKWQPTWVFLPGESQGQRSLVGCRLWGRTESDTTEVT